MLKIASLILIVSVSLFACTSDFNCGYGESCVKETFSSDGICMKNVNELGTQQYKAPDPKSVLPNMNTQGDCSSSSDCPMNFKYDYKYKVCVRR